MSLVEVLVADVLSSAGGVVFVALILASLVAATIAFAKVLEFRRRRLGARGRIAEALDLWERGARTQALDALARHEGATAGVARRAMGALLGHPEDRERARDLAIAAAVEESETLRRRLRALDTIVHAAPMLGLLGTVIGMIEAFAGLAATGGAADPGRLASGIWVALITTAEGLAVAIPFYFVSSWLDAAVSREETAMEVAVTRVLAAGPGQGAAGKAAVPRGSPEAAR